MKPDAPSRRQFLQVCGSAIAGGSLLALSGILLRRMYVCRDRKSLLSTAGCSACGVSGCPARKGAGRAAFTLSR